jgi:hypothetical protein
VQETAAAAVAVTEASGRFSATELAHEFPIHVFCEWIGSSPDVARRHYLQVTEEHFKKATSYPTSPMHADGRTEPHEKKRQPYPPRLRRIRLFRYPHGQSLRLFTVFFRVASMGQHSATPGK